MISSYGYGAYTSPYWSYTSANMPGSQQPTTQATDPTLSAILNPYQFQPAQQPAVDPNSISYTSALSSTYNSFNQLSQAANSLDTSNFGSVFNQRTTDTGGSTAISATAYSGATVVAYSVGVSQIATAQQNNGSLLTSSGTAGFSTGSNTMTLTVGGTSASLSVNVNAGDSNSTVLQNMATAINGANLGVTAQAVTLNENGTDQTKLVVTSNSTGTNEAFSLTDNTGNLVSTSGAGMTTTAAQNAVYTVNNTQYSSQSNNVTLDGGNLSLTLNTATSQNVNLNVSADTNAIGSAITNFVNQYNSTLNSLQSNSDVIDSSQYNQLTQAVSGVDLGSLGITVNSDNTLQIDQNSLTQALNTNFSQVQSTFGGPNGLAATVGAQAQTVSTSPLTGLLSNSFYSNALQSSSTQSELTNYQIGMHLNSMNMQMFSTGGNFFSSYF